MRIAQILHNQAHWIFEAEEMPDFPPDPQGNPIILIDITDKQQVREGWLYDSKTGEFSEVIYEPILEVVEISIDEQIYAETIYQTALLEMQLLGGN